MPWLRRRITDADKLLHELTRIEAAGALACRGDAGANATLYSSLDRALERARIGTEHGYIVEQVLIRRFAGNAGYHLSPPLQSILDDPLQTMILMRHYGAPTRLLDWTSSIWVAAYAAASERRHDSRGRWSDAAIWVFDTRAMQRGLERHGLGAEMDRMLGQGPPHNLEVPMRYALLSRRQLGRHKLRPPSPWVVFLYQLRDRFPRLIAQQGFFTVPSRLGLDQARVISTLIDPADEAVPRQCITFPDSIKPRVLQSLERKGITAASMFPGLEGIARHLSELTIFARLDHGIREEIRANG
ncbi:MAG: FRG domain-containing protein [Phycisphaerales bacterium]|nr:FRG domain-containing protein [Phycisphaerales bacterium]